MSDFPEFEAAARTAQDWTNELTRRLGWHDRRKVYRALSATLHALRDSLPPQEAALLADRLPLLLRGLYFEGWRLARYASLKSRESFLERVRQGVHRDPGVDAEETARLILAFLAERLPASELEDARAATPRALRAFWPV